MEEKEMRYFLIAGLLACAALTSTGCILPAYSGDPQRRIKQEMYDAENMRQASLEWERMWMVDKPSSLTMDRLSGTIM
jgi:hypothetical protein